jgi:hypothetical protein
LVERKHVIGGVLRIGKKVKWLQEVREVRDKYG